MASVLAACALTVSAPALAEPSQDRTEARAHFDRGVKLAKQQKYSEALAEFQSAYDAFPNHGVLYNIAQAQILLERPSAAVITLERYLAEGGAQIEPGRRREVEGSLSRQRAKTGTIALSVEPGGALITIDEQPIGRSPLERPIRVDAGHHRLKAGLESGESREITLEVAAQQELSAHLDLRVPPPAPPAPPVPPAIDAPTASPAASPTTAPAAPPPRPLAPRPADHSTQRTLGYALGAVGLALAGVTIGHYLWNRGRYEDWQSRSDDYYRDPTAQNRESANDLARSIPAASAVTVGLAIGAGVALASGTVLIIAGGSTQQPSASASLRGEF